MKKFLIFFLMLLPLAMTSCGGDKDEPSGGEDKAPSGVVAVDLGLSVKWASCNIGAQNEWEYGGLYAWGETEEKDEYSLSTYKYYDAATDTYENIGSDIKGTKYDVAHVKWGGKWRMPNGAEMNELRTQCKLTEVTVNGTKGILCTGPNGNTVFLPYAPHQYGVRKYGEGDELRFWCSGIGMKSSYAVYAYSGHANGPVIDIDNDTDRTDGFSVRAVCQ